MAIKGGIILRLSKAECEWLDHAAVLDGMTPREYVVRAVNERLARQGVDAVLLREREQEGGR